VPAHRIVAIDFDSQIGERLRAAFAPPEFEFRWYASGIEALAALQGFRPDAIICDVMLPDIDGRAVLDAVKRSPTLRDVPFVVLSGVRSEATVRATLDAGADAFLLKPFPVTQLVQTMRKVLRGPQSDAGEPPGERQRSSASGPGLSAVARAGREGASGSTLARPPAAEATGRQRIGFETRDPLLESPQPEPPVVPPASREALPSREDAAPDASETVKARVAPPIRLEGRISSLEVDGVRMRIVTEAEQGQSLVVRTTVARDGKELRRVETTLDEPLGSGDYERSLKDLIDLQHAGALQDISRLTTPAPRRREEPTLAETPGQGGAQDTEPATLQAESVELAARDLAPGEAVIFTRKPARDSPPAKGPRKAAKAKPGSARRKRVQPPLSAEPVLVESMVGEDSGARVPDASSVELDAIPIEQDAPATPAAIEAVSPPEPVVRRSGRAWLATVPVVLLVAVAAGVLIKGQFRSADAPQEPQPAVRTPPVAPQASNSPDFSPKDLPSEVSSPKDQPSEVSNGVIQAARPSPAAAAGRERLVRGRREWAQALYEAGRLEEASAALAEVFKLAPADAEARRLEAQILRTPRTLAPAAAEQPKVDAPAANVPATDQAPAEAPRVTRPTEPEIPAPAPEADRQPQAAQEIPEPPAPTPLEKREAAPEPLQPGALVEMGSPGLIAPVAQRKPSLAYPPAALRLRLEGTVELKALVDETGAVENAQLVSAPESRLGFGEAAIDYVRKWRFRPATKDGVPVKVWLPIRIKFDLPEQ
jgi:protein TonB